MTGQTWHPTTPVWRMTSITLDDYEQLLSVTAVVQAPAVDRIRQLVDNGGTIEVVRGAAPLVGPSLLWIELNLPQIRGLWRICRDIRPDDPRFVPGMTESLNKIADLLEGA